MDRTLAAVLAVLAAGVVIFLAVFALTVYIGITYRATLASTYEYRVSITNDAPLGNVTLYLPVPERPSGNSAVLEAIGDGGLAVPAGWETALIGTEKVTLLEVKARDMPPVPAGSPHQLSATTRVKDPVGTASEGFHDLAFFPLAVRTPAACTGLPEGAARGEAQCGAYQGTAYADFTGPRDVHLEVALALAGRNAWEVPGPSGNEYRDAFHVSFAGDRQGWQRGDGLLATGIGDYGMGFWIDWLGKISPREVSPRQIRVSPAGGRPA